MKLQFNATPNRFNTTKSKFSSQKKPRPKLRRTPLKTTDISNHHDTTKNIQNVQTVDPQHTLNNPKNNLFQKIPQKKLTLSIDRKNTAKKKINMNPTKIESVAKKLDFEQLENAMDEDSDSENEGKPMLAPSNLFVGGNKTMVQLKLEEIAETKKKNKPKKKVDALQRVKIAKLEQEKKERERQKKKEMNKRTIQENKRKNKLLEQQKYRKQIKKKNSHHQNHHNHRKILNPLKNNKNNKKIAHHKNIPVIIKKTKFKVLPNRKKPRPQKKDPKKNTKQRIPINHNHKNKNKEPELR